MCSCHVSLLLHYYIIAKCDVLLYLFNIGCVNCVCSHTYMFYKIENSIKCKLRSCIHCKCNSSLISYLILLPIMSVPIHHKNFTDWKPHATVPVLTQYCSISASWLIVIASPLETVHGVAIYTSCTSMHASKYYEYGRQSHNDIPFQV